MQKKPTKFALNQETLRNLTQRQGSLMHKTDFSCYISNCKLVCTPVAGAN